MLREGFEKKRSKISANILTGAEEIVSLLCKKKKKKTNIKQSGRRIGLNEAQALPAD
jgi:hypothetical protein